MHFHLNGLAKLEMCFLYIEDTKCMQLSYTKCMQLSYTICRSVYRYNLYAHVPAINNKPKIKFYCMHNQNWTTNLKNDTNQVAPPLKELCDIEREDRGSQSSAPS